MTEPWFIAGIYVGVGISGLYYYYVIKPKLRRKKW